MAKKTMLAAEYGWSELAPGVSLRARIPPVAPDLGPGEGPATGQAWREPEGSYLLAFPGETATDGSIGAVANVHAGPRPSLCYTHATHEYLREHCRPVRWCDLPAEWQQAFALYLGEHTP
jgi:hypothetical protein